MHEKIKQITKKLEEDWKNLERASYCLDGVINIGVQAFLRKCKILDAEAMEEEDDEEENEENDSDDDTDAELDNDAVVHNHFDRYSL